MDMSRKVQVINQKVLAINQTNLACSNMINEVRQLRLSVVDLFSTLADSGTDPQRDQRFDQENFLTNGNKLHQQQTLSKLATSHSLCTSSIPPPRIQKQQEQQQQVHLLEYVNQMISSITSSIRNLDKFIGVLIQNQSSMNPGESIHLAHDYSVEKHNLYVNLCQSYESFTKLNEYSTFCCNLLHQQSLKRVHKRTDTTTTSSTTDNPALSNQTAVATFNPYNCGIPKNHPTISSLLLEYITSKPNEARKFIEGVYSQPFGSSTGVFQVSVNRVLKAILIMRGFVVDAIIVKAYHESFAIQASVKGSSAGLLAESSTSPFVSPDDDIDLWTESKYAVFRKLTNQANGAILHFQYPSIPEIALKTFLNWFNSYADLFSATCSRCNSRLRKFMPPICRDFSIGFHPHHDSCK